MERSLIEFYKMNYRIDREKTAQIIPLKGTHSKLDPSFKLRGNGRMLLNVGRFDGSKMSTYFQAEKNTVLRLHGGVNISYGCDIMLFDGGILELSGCSLNSYSQIRCKNHISIGKNVRISRNVQIWDDDHHKIIGAKYVNKEVIIEDNVWIGAGVIILKGVHIGEGSMIAAGAVVTRDVPANSLAGGVPAKVIKSEFKWEY